ncbi:S9 family peptidase [Longibacter salinarum]|uniref:S9 family peptidase n=2 Tax=Longibacter salinarum TaxID=1850348 RepID=A0A2A8D210_9BACT|nr:S9 family peptidase [Longibacter salinarum]
MRFLALLCTLALLGGTITHAQPAADANARTSELSVEQIMQDPERWVGDWPENLRWHDNGRIVYFDWNPGGEFPSDSLFSYNVETGERPAKVSPEARRAAPPTFSGWHHGEHVYDLDQQRKVYTRDGDLYLYDRSADRITRLTDTPDTESSPRFSPDGRRVVYRRANELFSLSLTTGLTRQLTDLRSGRGPAPDTTAQDAFLYEQQTALFETLREEHEKQEKAKAARERERAADNDPPTYYYGDGSLRQLQIDPSERFVSFTVQEESPDAEETLLADYVTLSGFAEAIEARPKVGIQPGAFALYVQDVQRDTTYEVDLHQLPGAYDIPAYQQEQGVEMDSSEAKRSLYAYGPYWNSEGSNAVLVVRADDNKDRWIARLDAATGDLTVLDRQQDDAWVGGPGISAYGGPGTIGWMPDGETVYFQSEATGWSHLYTVDVSSGEITQLTTGEFEVSDPRLSEDGSTWTFQSTEESAHELHVYEMDADGGDRTRLTDRSGQHFTPPSPTGTLATLYEYSNRPPDIYVQDRSETAEAERVTSSPTDEWLAYDWRDPKIITFEASDGVDVPAHLYRPDDSNGAAVMFVHGAGYTQNVIKGWPYYFREMMFHNMLADLGYTVIDIDYRGSAGYGRDWRTAIYRHMGGRDLGDYVDGSAYLQDEFGINPERTFIYGGSYGGFMTLMGLFTAPESFGGGAALRSVTDWAHYNDIYTSNILNTPATDSIAYARSSPIYFAEGLEDPLLMPHGLVDANVQPQDIFRLSQRLIELGKEDWELAMYPVEPHSFEKPSSWTDEYRRIFELIQESVGPMSEHADSSAP